MTLDCLRSYFVDLVRRASGDTSGVVAVLFAISAVPLLIGIGAGVDYSRLITARTAAQSAADAAALAAASSRIETELSMKLVADGHAAANLRGSNADGSRITEFAYRADKREVTLAITGSVPTSFMGITGIQSLSYRAEARAIRGLNGTTELVLVLDNTWSMVGNKLVALKQSAEDLVVALRQDPNADVKIGVVPYADYVNVGTANRNAPWLSVPADYSTTSQRTCVTKDTKSVCTRGSPKTCTRVVDGISETYDCTPSTCRTENVAPYESCSGGGTTHYRWYGCVGSRTSGSLRLNDTQPSTPYPGYLATSQNCLNPIVPLTASQSTVISAIRDMRVNIGNYKPLTYIPAGLIWGVNVLSPSMPFSEGAAYDPGNRRPRKVMVLMTDGANTLRFNAADGRHLTPSGNATNQANQLAQTYSDMAAICTFAKQQQIEIFTVAFEITDPVAMSALRNCATTPGHAFDAKDRQSLADAFKNIAMSLTNVRITR